MFRYLNLNLKRYFGNSAAEYTPSMDIGNGNYMSPHEFGELYAEIERMAKITLAMCGEL